MEKFAGVCVIKDGKILLVQEAHREAEGLWSLPLGHVEPHETEAEAAIREFKEETGYEAGLGVAKKLFLSGKDLKSTGNFNDKDIELAIFHGKIQAGDLRPGNDVLDARWIPLDQIGRLPLRGGWVQHFIKEFNH